MKVVLAIAPLRRPGSGALAAVLACLVAAASLSSAVALHGAARRLSGPALAAAGANVSAERESPASGARAELLWALASLSRSLPHAAAPLVLVESGGGSDPTRFGLRAPAGEADGWASLLSARMPGWRVRPVPRVAEAERRALAVLSSASLLLTGGGLFACTLCLTASLLSLLAARRRQFALLSALGADRGDLLRVIAMECSLYAVLGGALGGLVGAAAASAVSRAALGAPAPLGAAGAGAVALGLAAVVAASLVVPYRRLGHLRPATVLRGE